MDLFERNRKKIPGFIQYFTEKVYSEKLRNLAFQVSRARRTDFKTGQFLMFFQDIQDRTIEGVII